MHIIITSHAFASVNCKRCFFHTVWQELSPASHQTFMRVKQGDLQTRTDSCHIPADSGVPHMEQTPSGWLHQTGQQGRTCREDVRHLLMCTSCREGAPPGDQTQVSRQACRGHAQRSELFVWLCYRVEGNMLQHVWLATPICGACVFCHEAVGATGSACSGLRLCPEGWWLNSPHRVW